MGKVLKGVGKLFGLETPKPPKKTAEQIRAEDDAATAAREERQALARGEGERKRGMAGRAQLSYNRPGSMLGGSTRLGPGG